MGFYFTPSPTDFPLYRPMPTVFHASTNIHDISLALSRQHILEDKSGALHVINLEEHADTYQLLCDDIEFFPDMKNKLDELATIAREAGVLPDDLESLVDDICVFPDDLESLVQNILEQENYDEREMTFRRINWLEQKDEDNVDQLVFEVVCVAQQLIQNRGGELDMILGERVYTVNGVELRDCQDPPTTPETLLNCCAKLSCRVWLGHGGQWAAEFHWGCNRLNIGSLTTMEDAMSAYDLVIRWSGRADLTSFPRLFENENRSKLPLWLPPPAQELNLVEDFGLVWCNAMGNDEIEAVGTGSQGTEECVMAYQTRLNYGGLGKKKSMEKNPGGERRNKKTNGVRTVIPLEDILQIKGMRLKDAANHLKVSITKLKSSCREYGIPRWPPRNERKLTRQSLLNGTCHVVDQEGIPQLTSHSNQVLMATVDKNIVDEREIPQLLPTAQQENTDAGFGNDEAEAIGIGVEGTREDVIEKTQLNSGCSGKGEWKENSPEGDRGHNKTTGVRISIPKEDILETKGMRLADAAKHLEVSRSTFKRACREYGIERWPPRKKRELNSQSHPNESPAVVDQERIPQSNSDMLLPSAQVSALIGMNNVTIMARYGEVRIKFRLSWLWRMVELEQQVKKRLPLEAGTYYIKYKDEDDGLMTLIACDEDLEDYISSSSRLGTHPIEVFLEPKLASS
ncbi:uncharacterized protein LOC131315527 [Rhododendron vialii]|uniref:uncharacterized protein LOC131315527 n=1 Tax=Rhododendron vialii TaxID=182163 RepID=UPI00265EEEF8|nr:uncharacterized protein LOC131315527 [Rhododendron vialii]